MANCFLLLACLLFSFACNLIKKLYDDQDYSTVLEMLKSAAISGIAGFLFAMLLSEFFVSPIIVISLSGLGGFFGTKGLNALVQSNISSKIFINDALKQLLNETDENQLIQRVNHILEQDRALFHDNHEENDTPQEPLPDGDNQSLNSQIVEDNQHVKIHVIRRDS